MEVIDAYDSGGLEAAKMAETSHLRFGHQELCLKNSMTDRPAAEDRSVPDWESVVWANWQYWPWPLTSKFAYS